MSFLETLRRWVDGDDGEDALSRAAAEQARPRRQAEEFIAQIARAIGEVMHREAVPLPPDQTVIPPEYIVFLSDDDDRDWQGVKRRALEQGLHHVLAEHARDLAGKTKLATSSFSVELRVDGTLEKGEIRVQHSWKETSSSNKTSITPRVRNNSAIISNAASSALPSGAQSSTGNLSNSGFNQNSDTGSLQTAQSNSSQLAPTMLDANFPISAGANQSPEAATQVTPRGSSNSSGHALNGNLDNETTRVHKRELFRVEIWRGNQKINVVPINKEEITIGRKSNKVFSDLQLEDDPEISRPHAVLRRDLAGNFWLTQKGKNPTLVNNREIALDQSVQVAPGEPITICSYVLRIQS